MGQISYKQELLRKMIHLSSLWMVCAIIFSKKTAWNWEYFLQYAVF